MTSRNADRSERQEDDTRVGTAVLADLAAGVCALVIVFAPLGPVEYVLAAVAVGAAVVAIRASRTNH